MIDRKSQEELVNHLINNLDVFDEDLLEKLQESLDNNLSNDSRYIKFINLYENTQNLLDRLIKDKSNVQFDIWEFMWERLFEKNGLVHQARKLYPFRWTNIDSSYEDEVNWCMGGWQEAVNEVKLLIDKNKYFENNY